MCNRVGRADWAGGWLDRLSCVYVGWLGSCYRLLTKAEYGLGGWIEA